MSTAKPKKALAENLAIRRVLISELHNDPANVRLHNRRNIDAIISSLKTFGQVEPLVVQKGTNKVIGGNGRLEALREMGATEVDIVEIEADNLKATALGIVLNRTAELADWDNEALSQVLIAAGHEGINHEELGFSIDDIAKICSLDELPANADGKEYDESIANEVQYHVCPNCSHQWPK